MKVVITCGPSFEPVDEVRRLTNHSTGQTGAVLANRLARSGADVTCFRGAGATDPTPMESAKVVAFTTNDDLRAKLRAMAGREGVAAVFHAAALCDYRVGRITSATGWVTGGAKIPSNAGGLTLQLEPATKLLPELRQLFPKAKIVGWKYELSGSRDEAVAKGLQQIKQGHADACVVNGAAFGEGLGLLRNDVPMVHCTTKLVLAEQLARWIAHAARVGS